MSNTYDTTDPRAGVREFLSQHPAVRLETIDGVFVRGVCACGTPVMKDTKGYRYDSEAEKYVCPACNKQER